MKIMIFSGTTEGRTLSSMLDKKAVEHIVCVATGYGDEMTHKDDHTKVHTGRMDRSQMEEYMRDEGFGAGDMIIDATHPYATEVTDNIKNAAGALDIKYLRVLRKESDEAYEHRSYNSIEECARQLDGKEGNILLTTGSKELTAFYDHVSEATGKRTYVRILPTAESMDICLKAGIDQKNIIAMQGPFSEEMNMAVMKQYDIRHLVTKESGNVGGYGEKMSAASKLGISCHVISRPVKEQGVDLNEAYLMITGEEYKDDHKKRITIAGYGMGADASLTYGVKQAIKEADAIFGASRLTDKIDALKKYPYYLAKDIIPVLEEDDSIKNALILVTGDCGFYSGAKALCECLKERFPGSGIRLLPGISSVAYLSALTGESYDDACIRSIHGRKNEMVLNSLIHDIRYDRKTFVLLSGREDIIDIANLLIKDGIDCRMIIGSNLSYEEESVESLSPQQAMAFDKKGPCIALIVNDSYERRPIIDVLSDDAFEREKVPMTKECIRHESIICLKLYEGDVLYDIGGGTGSVAIEAAHLHPSVKVYTFERNESAVKLIRRNIEKHNALNVTLIEGEAPSAFEDIQAPDSVFIGGSGGHLEEIIEAISKKKMGVTYVINAVSLETIQEVNRLIRQYNISDAKIMQLSCTNINSVGDYHMMQAQNPVMIFSFKL